MKYFNGECCDFAQESISCILSLSLTVKCGQNFENFETAVKSVEQECINVSFYNNFKTFLKLFLFCFRVTGL